MRLGRDKDHITLMLGFDKFWRENGRPDVRLYIVGDGDRKNLLEMLHSELESRDQIIFTGTINEPFGYMRGAIAHVLSSPSEGLPTTLIEAAACGTLNIASDCKSGPREILMNGDAGILFTPGDFEELARIFADVYNKKINAKPMIEIARKNLCRFDAKVTAAAAAEFLVGLSNDN